MYCPECGHKLEEDNFRFCPECGAVLGDDNENGAKNGREKNIYGILFTNLKTLAESLHTSVESVTSAIERFIEDKKKYGVHYILTDAGNYTYGNKSSFGIRKKVHLDSSSGFEKYMDIVCDMYENMTKDGILPTHLFIIGGDNVIPMPQIQHYIKDSASDETIDTDILYSYPYKGDLIRMLENQEIFSYRQCLLTGRLPFGKDASIYDLTGYLGRALEVSGGIESESSYGQCDPNWKKVSSLITVPLKRKNLLPDYGDRVSEKFYYRKLFLSPFVDHSNVGQVFNTRASLYYFNLHGGEGEGLSGYYGALPPEYGEHKMYTAITPESMASAEYANVVVSEACYGAKFIDLRKEDSMMLTSLGNRTIVFAGSSRIAWGACDDRNRTEEQHTICSADIIAKTFMESMLKGLDAGEAFFIARKELMTHAEPGDLFAAVTVTEFNLYGDPTSRFKTDTTEPDITKSASGQVISEPLKQEHAPAECMAESIDPDTVSSASARPSGILDMVRGAVDSNLAQISQNISEHLYGSFGIEPRKPYSIMKIKQNGKNTGFYFFYDTGKENSSRFMVKTDTRGKIHQIQSSK